MLRRRADLLLAIVVAVALLAALPSFALGRDLTPVSSAVRQSTPAVASDGVDFFAVWTETTSTTSRIVAGRVTRSGLPLDGTGIVVAESSISATTRVRAPAVAFGAGAYLVVFTVGISVSSDVMGRRYTREGTPVDPAPFPIAHNAGSASVAFGGTRFLVAWPRYNAQSIIGTTVAADGSAGVEQQLTPPLAQELNDESGDLERPMIGWNGRHFIVAYIVWEYAKVDFLAPIIAWRVRVLRASPLGAPIDAHTIRAVEGGNTAAVACSAEQCVVGATRGGDIVAVVVQDDETLHADAPKVAASSHSATSAAIAFDGASYLLAWHADDALLGLSHVSRGGQPYALSASGTATPTDDVNPYASPPPPALATNSTGDTAIVTTEFDKVSLNERARFYLASELPPVRRRAAF
jgi:hypothetical protein